MLHHLPASKWVRSPCYSTDFFRVLYGMCLSFPFSFVSFPNGLVSLFPQPHSGGWWWFGVGQSATAAAEAGHLHSRPFNSFSLSRIYEHVFFFFLLSEIAWGLRGPLLLKRTTIWEPCLPPLHICSSLVRPTPFLVLNNKKEEVEGENREIYLSRRVCLFIFFKCQ